MSRIVEGATRLCLLLLITASTTGCLSKQLLRMDAEQRRAQLEEIEEASQFLEPDPVLNAGYDGRVFVSGQVLNAFLKGFDQYSIPLESPPKTSILIEQAALNFEDGSTEVVVTAKGLRQGWPVEVKLRVHAQLVLEPAPEQRKLVLGLRVLKILPDVKLSIFRLREFYFAQRLMRIKAQEYVDALPRTEIELKPDFRIDINSRNYSDVKTNHDRGWIRIRTDNPAVSKQYRYTVFKVIPLEDGLHLFFRLEGEAS